MKTVHCSFLVWLLVLSCSKTGETIEEIFVPDPTIISEYHHFNHDGSLMAKYIFDEIGRLSEYLRPDYISVSYSYDENHKLIKIVKTDLQSNSNESFSLTYDSENRILNFGNNMFTYYPNGNYLIDSPHSEYEYIDENDNNILYTEILNHKYFINENGFINEYCGYEFYLKTYLDTNNTEIIWEGCGGIYFHSFEYLDNVITSSDQNDNNPIYIYDDNTNPLYFPESNILDLALILPTQYYGLNNSDLFPFVSKNNLIEWDNGDGGSESYKLEINFNDTNLPVKSYYQSYYLESPEGNPYVIAKYYYQGDTIPE